jgi:hypothetical protein
VRVTLTLLKRRGREQKAGGTETKDHGNPDCQPKGVPPYILGVSKGRGATINQSYHVISIKDICAIYPRKKKSDVHQVARQLSYGPLPVGCSQIAVDPTL